jgi:hypothetical protein
LIAGQLLSSEVLKSRSNNRGRTDKGRNEQRNKIRVHVKPIKDIRLKRKERRKMRKKEDKK